MSTVFLVMPTGLRSGTGTQDFTAATVLVFLVMPTGLRSGTITARGVAPSVARLPGHADRAP